MPRSHSSAPRLRSSLVAALLAGGAGAQTPLLRFEDGTANPWESMSAVGIGDVDGDGLGEVALARPYAEGWNGSLAVASSRTGQELWHVDGSRGARLGLTLTGGVDVDRDGRGDVVVMSYPLLGPTLLHMFSGADGSPIWSVPDGVTGSRALAFAADFDGDGVRDLLCGIPFLSLVGSGNGVVQVRSGATGALLFQVEGATGDYLGASVVGLGDVDRDGTPDFAAGAHEGLPGLGQGGPGHVSVFSGRTGALLRRVDGTVAAGDFGGALAVLDDLDGDGLGELLVGAPYEHGGAAHVVSPASGTTLRSHFGAGVSELGFSVCALGDIDGDGRGEYAVAAPRENLAGVVRVHSGADGSILFDRRGVGGQRFGFRIAPARDPNADGVPDLLVLVAVEGGLTRSWTTLFSGSVLAPLGRGCANGANPPELDLDQLVLGSTTTLHGRGLPPGTPGCIFFSLVPWLPTVLDPDCSFYLDAATIYGTVEVASDGSGDFVRALLLPTDPWLAGIATIAQAAFPAPSALSGVALTHAVVGTLGS